MLDFNFNYIYLHVSLLDRLNTPICMQELWVVIGDMNKQSCAGIDELPIYFYTKHWDLIKDDMLAGMQYIMEEGLMPTTMCRGMVFLIPKDGKDLTTLDNWRPLTILTNAYKIMAKVVSKRLKMVVGDIIHTTQTGFLENWGIVDNVITFWEYSALRRSKKWTGQ